jgi:carbonic anhydrase
MKRLEGLFKHNKAWAARVRKANPDFFLDLSKQQTPKYMWIGCADSRVPATEIVDLAPGEIFVHRNVANIVVHSDFNCLSVLEFAVDVLHVKHVMVVGHYGCGGVKAVIDDTELRIASNWLGHVRDVHERHKEELGRIKSADKRFDRLCELNVLEQALNVCKSTVVRAAWKRHQNLTVHGWIYGLKDGLLHDLDFCVSGAEAVPERVGA